MRMYSGESTNVQVSKTTEINNNVISLYDRGSQYLFEHTLDGIPLRTQMFRSLKIAIKVFNETETEILAEVMK